MVLKQSKRKLRKLYLLFSWKCSEWKLWLNTLSAFYYPDQLEFYENRQFTKLYHKQIGTRQAKGIAAGQEESETFFD